KFYDVQKYLSTTGHAYDALVLVASGKFWDRLSESDRQLLREVAREATLYQRQTSRELNAKLREELVGLGMQINDVAPEERERMREALQGVIDKHAAVSGADVTEQFRQALAASSQAGGAK